jgi:chromosome segregation ATPase
MDLFSSNDPDDLSLDDLPSWRDVDAVSDWRERRTEAQKSLESAKKELRELKDRKAKAVNGGLVESSYERLKERVEKGSIDKRIQKKRREVQELELHLEEVKRQKDEVYAEAVDQLQEEVDEHLAPALEQYIEALHAFSEAKKRLQALDSWVNNLNTKHGATRATRSPLGVPYDLQRIPGIRSPISADQLAENLDSDA